MATLRLGLVVLITFMCVVHNTEAMWGKAAKRGYRVAKTTLRIAKKNKIPKLNVFLEQYERSQAENDNNSGNRETLRDKCLNNNWLKDKVGGLWGLFPTPRNRDEDLTLLRQRIGSHLASLGTTFNFDNVAIDQHLPIELKFLEVEDNNKAAVDDEGLCKLSKSTNPESASALAISDDVMTTEIIIGEKSQEEIQEYLKTKFAGKFLLLKSITQSPLPPERQETVD